ncbi:50S ribosomal protein L11 methyltransferase [Sesbania bispinosa]|nr:50S ribosomal protein L11 methyltransferase [Sesbania bispinosa]
MRKIDIIYLKNWRLILRCMIDSMVRRSDLNLLCPLMDEIHLLLGEGRSHHAEGSCSYEEEDSESWSNSWSSHLN